MTKNDIVYARSEILDLSYLYAKATDRVAEPGGIQLLRQVFTGDGINSVPHLDLEMVGIGEIEAGIGQIKDMFDSTLHSVTNQLVEFEDSGSLAKSETYCVANHIYRDDKGDKRKLDWGIRYLDSLVVIAGRWRIRQRTLVQEWQQDLSLGEL